MVKPTRVTNQIRALRFAHGEMTQAELAERIGVTRQTVIAIEQGRYSPSLEMAFQIAHAFGVPLDDVFQYPQGIAATYAGCMRRASLAVLLPIVAPARGMRDVPSACPGCRAAIRSRVRRSSPPIRTPAPTASLAINQPGEYRIGPCDELVDRGSRHRGDRG